MSLISKECVSKWANYVKAKPIILKDTISIGPTVHLLNLLNSILNRSIQSDHHQPHFTPYKYFHQGFHFLFNNQLNLKLDSDGYDTYQAPSNPQGDQLYLRRLWARGEIQFPQVNFPQINSTITCKETIKSVRMIEQSTFVTIIREFIDNEQASVLTESRTLSYTNQLYTPKIEPVKLISPAESDKLIQISSVDLLKYSMLTYNLHKIHLFPKYCRSIEDLPTTVIHGPLQVTLLLYWFAVNHPNSTPVSFKYRTYEPCFVNDEISLQIKEITSNQITLSLYDKNSGKVYIDGTLTTKV
ncbi:Hydroxyacyl-thioester dehydratase type 2 mitochondrial [Spathaspora sp. JA1]|nr:Hydroxyacyl-thioester dehydratase type 2 mitochondrial [Spathaspora sp. JA1]